MKDRKPAPAKDRRDIGEVVFPIEKLKAALASRYSCVHTEAVLESGSSFAELIKSPSHSAVMGKDPM
jgi:hypothetical protein